jgi:CRP-like cAMP-binding protein
MLTPELIAELRSIGRPRRYKRGQRVVREGERLGAVVVLLEGLVKVVASSYDGDEHILALRGPGEVIGDLSVICDSTASATVEVLEDVDATLVAAGAYLEFLQSHPDFMLGQLRRVIEVLRQSDSKRLELATLDLTARVARGLLEAATAGRTAAGTAGSGSDDDGVPVSQEELAHLCGASREAVARVLRTFRDRGWVRTERRRVVVVDREGLESVTGNGL